MQKPAFLLPLLLISCSSELPEPAQGLGEQGSFLQGDDFAEVVPGRCVSLSSYDVIARGQIGAYSEVALQLQNACGDRDVAVENVELMDVDGAFALISNIPDAIPAGGSVELRISFEARADIIHLGELLVETDDATSPRQIASLYGLVSDGLRSGAAPSAYAGANSNSAQTGSTVNLDGSGSSDPEGDSLTYRWSFHTLPGGSSLTYYASITNSTSVNASFTPDVSGTYRVRLVVSDGTSVDKDFADYSASASGVNTSPTADAGANQTITEGATASLDGSGSSDPEGGALTYSWTLHSAPAGSALSTSSISGRSTASASVTPDVDGTFGFKLTVSDGLYYAKDFVWITVEAATGGPTDDDGDSYTSDVDCNDSNAAIHPGASEVCDNVDNDCSGTVDDNAVDESTWYADNDSDGYGDSASSTAACDQPTNYVSDDTDCDDTDAGVNPGASEVNGDGIDQDCDGSDAYTYTYDANIQSIWNSKCAGCHTGGGSSGGLSLSSYDNQVNVPSDDVPSMDLIEPGSTADSYIWHKLQGTHTSVGGSGSTMPMGGSMTSTQLSTIQTWIEEGAPRN